MGRCFFRAADPSFSPPPSSARYCRLYRLQTTLPTLGPCDIAFTAVAGHMTELDFTGAAKAWRGVDPASLFAAPVAKRVPDDKKPIEANLKEHARWADTLVLWLDCDREGENIAFEVVAACAAANPRLTVLRARFSSLSEPEIARALASLGPPDEAAARAVDARQEIDLRVGASFTRLQSLLLQDKFDWDAGGAGGADGPARLISYGPCQFPTLGLIVRRAWEARAHVAEGFWSLQLSVKVEGDGNGGGGGGAGPTAPTPTTVVPFKWARGALFDHAVAATLYEAALTAGPAVVTAVDGRRRTREPPPPLSTLELQKAATRRSILGLPGDRVMKLAEELYQQGFISYPRTETDEFDADYDLASLVAPHAAHPLWGPHVSRLASGELWRRPRSGGHNDRAHPPIHPTKMSAGEAGWCADKKRLYDFVARSFLAACTVPAVGFETRVEAAVGGERFGAAGLVVAERGWLAVYPYAGWGGAAPPLPPFAVGDRFAPHALLLVPGQTQPPPRLAEGDLLAAMDRHGIGTDATMVDHVKTLLARRYAAKDATACFSPTPLGEALVSAYARMGLASLWTPDLRGRIEAGIRAIAAGAATKETVLADAMAAFAADFEAARRASGVLEEEVGRFFPRAARARAAHAPVGPCAACGATMMLIEHESGAFLECGAAPLCRAAVALPPGARAARAASSVAPCARCGAAKLDLVFRRGSIPAGFDAAVTACALGCDRGLRATLAACGDLRVPRRGPAPGARGRAVAGRAPPQEQVPPPGAAPPAARRRAPAGGRGGAALEGCPVHGLPVLTLTTRNGQNAGRQFVKCSVDGEQDGCLPFAWADEWGGGGAGAPAGRGRGAARGGRGGAAAAPRARTAPAAIRGRGRGGRGARGRGNAAPAPGRFASAVPGAAAGGCYRCGEPGHWANSCPNAGG